MSRTRKRAFPSKGSSDRSVRWILIGVLIYCTINLGRLVLQEFRLLGQGRILRQELAASIQKAADLQASIREAKTPMGVERLARKNLGMTRPGEEPVRFLDPKEAQN